MVIGPDDMLRGKRKICYNMPFMFRWNKSQNYATFTCFLWSFIYGHVWKLGLYILQGNLKSKQANDGKANRGNNHIWICKVCIHKFNFWCPLGLRACETLNCRLPNLNVLRKTCKPSRLRGFDEKVMTFERVISLRNSSQDWVKIKMQRSVRGVSFLRHCFSVTFQHADSILCCQRMLGGSVV